MSDFDAALREADADIFAAVGGQGVLQDDSGRRHVVQCSIEEDVDVHDDFGKVIAKRDLVDILLPPFVKPVRGWRIDIGQTSWLLDMPQATDGSVHTWSVRK